MIVALGQAVSMLGSHGVQFALIWWLAEKTSSPLMLGISGLVAYLPMTLFSPLAGIAADRYNRKFISVFSDMAMGMAALIYAVLLFFFDLPVWTVLVMLCVRGIGSTFQQPAIQSIIPQLVPKDQLVKTNGWMQLLNSGSFLLGPVIGASLYAIFPMSVVLMSDVAGAILASIALAVVKIPKLEKPEQEEQHFTAEIKEGLQIFKEDKKLLHIVTAEALCMFFYAPLSSFYPLMTSDYFKLSAMYGSAVELSFAIGMMVSSLLFSSVLKINRKIRVSFIGLLGMGIMSLKQSDSRKGRGKCMVLHFRSVYDCTYCRRFLTVCGRMSEQDAAAVNIIPSIRNVLRRISPGSQERILLCRILRLRRVAQATSSIPPQCDPRGAFSQFFCRTTVWPSSIQ